jgi:asparagine synthase (glutamine-hydrolysing)
MAKVGHGRVKTFTIGFEADQVGVDERPFAKAIADQYGTDHSEYLYESPQTQIEGMLPAIVRSFDEPFADSSAIPNFMISEAARKYVTVAMSGTGGDELFAGYERYRGALAAERYRRVPRALRRAFLDPIIHRFPEVRAAGLWVDRLKRFIEAADLPLTERYQRFLCAFDEREKMQLLNPDVSEVLRQTGDYITPLAMHRATAWRDPLDRMLMADMEGYLPDNELRKTDRLSMWHSLEVRVPFLDHKVVEFAASIPASFKLNGITKKYVLIKALKGAIPHKILARRKQGFSIPLNEWLRGPLRELMLTSLSSSTLEKAGVFNPVEVAKLIYEHQQGVKNHENRIWALMIFTVWHQLYLGS